MEERMSRTVIWISAIARKISLKKIKNQLKSIISIYHAYYIIIHESTDVWNSTQLAVFIQKYDVNIKDKSGTSGLFLCLVQNW